ncbi:aldo-keto reductase [Peziza echinospora]|nr:aldo-keto reductase [Peziza echinospora]
MEHQNLGTSGLKSSKIILGTMSFGSSEWADWVKDEEESLKLLKAAYDLGINTWDTADAYSNGLSEVIIGKAIKKYEIPRERLVLLTKCHFGFDEGVFTQGTSFQASSSPAFVNRCGLSRKHIFDAVADSVRRLGTYIDVLQIHRLDHSVPMEEIMRALHDVIQTGQVRYIGASSMYTWEFQMMQNIAEKHGWTKFISMQNYYNLLNREEEREMIPYCKHTGVGLIPWSPLARGVLARPWHNRDTVREKSDKYLHYLIRSSQSDSDEKTIRALAALAEKRRVSMATVATAWILKKGMIPIIGLSSEQRIKEAVEAVSFVLDEDEVRYVVT